MSEEPEPRNIREARRWVREHWGALMRGYDCPDFPEEWTDEAQDRVADVFCDVSRRLADRIDPPE